MKDRGRVGKAGGFDDHAIKFRYFTACAPDKKIPQSRNQVATHRTANAAGIEQHHIFGNFADQKMIQTDFTKFIDQNGSFVHAVLSEQGVKQGCFATAEKTGDDRGRNAFKLFVG